MVDLQAMLVAAADVPLTPENVRPGWIALGVVAALCVAVFFLGRSFFTHTRRAQQPWEGEETPASDTDDAAGHGDR